MGENAESLVPSATELLRLVGNLSHALYTMLACERCWATGTVVNKLGADECPQCFGRKSAHPNALERVSQVAARCEELTLAMAAEPSLPTTPEPQS